MRARFLSDTSAVYSSARFLVTGFLFAALYFAIYIALMRLAGIPPWLAAMLAFASLIPPHFYAHARFSFRHSRRDVLTFARYAAAIAGIAAVNGALVWLYYDVLLADALAAQVLALPFVLGLNFVLFRWGVFNEHASLNGLQVTPQRLVATAAAVLGLIALYVIVASIILYTNGVFRLDEIHLNHDYLFSDVSESIFGRQNGHLIVFPGLVFAANLFLLDGKGMWLAFVIVGANAATCIILCVLFAQATLRLRLDRASITLGAVIISLAVFWLSGGRTLYWGVGVHNYLAGLGAVAACLGLAIFAHERFRAVGLSVFLAGAILASASFNAGAAVWGLAPVAAILSRRAPRVVVVSIVVAMVGGLLAIGLFAIAADKAAGRSDLLSLPMFAATFLGAPVIEPLIGKHAEFGEKIPAAALVGGIGILITAVAAVMIFLSYSRSESRRFAGLRLIRTQLLVFVLLSAFGIGASILVGLGRMQSHGFETSLAPRFASWAVLFWTGVTGLVLLGAALRFDGAASRPWAYTAVAIGAGALLLTSDIWFFRTLPSRTNAISQSVAMVVVDPVGRQDDLRLWKNNDWVLRLMGELKARHSNVFAEPWARAVGKSLQETGYKLSDTQCVGRFSVADDQATSSKLRGIAWSEGLGGQNIRAIMLVRDEQVRGIGLPLFAEPAGKGLERGLIVAAFRLLPQPLSMLPGISGHFTGYVLTPDDETPFDSLYGVLDEHRICRIGS